MSALVTVLRAASLLAFAGPILLTIDGRDRKRSRGADRRRGDRTPVLTNFAAFGLFFALLVAFIGCADRPVALLLALCGCLLAVAGSALVLRSRGELGMLATPRPEPAISGAPYARARGEGGMSAWHWPQWFMLACW